MMRQIKTRKGDAEQTRGRVRKVGTIQFCESDQRCRALSERSLDCLYSRKLSMVTHTGFDEVLLEAVDYGTMALDEIVSQTICQRLKNHYGLKLKEIHEDRALSQHIDRAKIATESCQILE